MEVIFRDFRAQLKAILVRESILLNGVSVRFPKKLTYRFGSA